MRSAQDWIAKSSRLEGMQYLFRNVREQNPVSIKLYALLAFAAILVVIKLFNVRRRAEQDCNARRSTPQREKPTSVETADEKQSTPREFGSWTPSDFQRPTAEPYKDWSVTDTKPLPYRPFRYGPYHITMGLRSMDWNDWIELDNQYLHFHSTKARRIAERGRKCIRTAPETQVQDAAVELLEELCAYLPERYPSMFRSTDVGIDNLVTHESFHIANLTVNGNQEDPMALCARLVQDDLAIMFERQDGQYYLLAAAILLAGFWRLEDKFGMSLSNIHTSGSVPGYESKLENGMMNFFRRLKPSAPMVRNNYFIQVDDDLAWSHSIGAEDSEHISWATAAKDTPAECMYFRSERQSLRRLPRSGGVVFTIRTYFVPVVEMAGEVGVPGRLASAVRSWGEDVAGYKGRERFAGSLGAFLEGRHREQVGRGVVGEEREEGGGTLGDFWWRCCRGRWVGAVDLSEYVLMGREKHGSSSLIVDFPPTQPTDCDESHHMSHARHVWSIDR